MFIDEAEIYVKAGDGGNGAISFRREKFVPFGGPDGGDGGDGGSVYCVADLSVNTLQHLVGKHHWKAGRGGDGMGKKCFGKGGRDITILLPIGTIIRDKDYGTILKDLVNAGDKVCVAEGGRGGYGNVHYATPTHQAPRTAKPGVLGQERNLKLELKLIADVGLLGMPNAGKSTLLAHLSAARPKIADYPFTTLEPVLGIVEIPGERRFVMADIPGIIEGAHRGVGLGDAFLKHVERTSILVHIVDILPPVGEPGENLRKINEELRKYSTLLGGKKQILVANKMDLTGAQEALEKFQGEVGQPVFAISAATGQGLRDLAEMLWTELHPRQPWPDAPR